MFSGLPRVGTTNARSRYRLKRSQAGSATNRHPWQAVPSGTSIPRERACSDWAHKKNSQVALIVAAADLGQNAADGSALLTGNNQAAPDRVEQCVVNRAGIHVLAHPIRHQATVSAARWQWVASNARVAREDANNWHTVIGVAVVGLNDARLPGPVDRSHVS